MDNFEAHYLQMTIWCYFKVKKKQNKLPIKEIYNDIQLKLAKKKIAYDSF